MNPRRAGYILTKPLHESQTKISNDETGLKIALKLIPNPELLQVLLSFGSDLKVLAPASLLEKILQEAQAVAAGYTAFQRMEPVIKDADTPLHL